MSDFKINQNGVLEILASVNSAHTDFDFYIGKWKIRNRKLNERLNHCDEWTEFDSTDDTTHLLRGFANMNKFSATFDGQPFEGIAIRLFNPQTKLWLIYWADSNAVAFDPPMVGSLMETLGNCIAKILSKVNLLLYYFIGIK
jgi:hypothetical protein